MGRWARAGCLAVLGLGLGLVGCGPIYRTEYRFLPPPNDTVRACVFQCEGLRLQCVQISQLQRDSCQDRAERDYHWCMRNRVFQYREDGSRRCVRNCSCHRDYCSDTADRCDVSYRGCYQMCGGGVVEERTCVLNCP